MSRIILLTRERGTWLAWECAQTGLDETVSPENVVEHISATNPDATVVIAAENRAAAQAQLDCLTAAEADRLRW